MLDVTAVITGPLFDGRAKRAVDDFGQEVERRTADAAVDRVRLRLDSSTRHPTGRYRAAVHAERGGDGWAATDGGRLPYGHWLEGTSRRNRSTGFPGYHAFRDAHIATERAVEQIAEQAWPVYKRRME